MKLIERLKYTHKRNWFCSIRILGIKIPYIATDWDIEIDLVWRDIQQKKRNKLKNENTKVYNS